MLENKSQFMFCNKIHLAIARLSNCIRCENVTPVHRPRKRTRHKLFYVLVHLH